MTREQKKQYQWLQILVYFLQLEEEKWPFEEIISRPDAFAEVIRFASISKIDIDPTNPDFLSSVAAEIAKALAQPPEQPIPSIPKNLRELVEIYEKHLAEKEAKIEKTTLAALFPTLDEQIKTLYEHYQKSIQTQLAETEKTLAQNPRLLEIISGQIASKLIPQLPQVATEQAFERTLRLEDYQEMATTTIKKELEKTGFKPPVRPLLEKMAKTIRPEVRAIAATPHTLIPIREIKKPPPLTTAEKEVIQVKETLGRQVASGFVGISFPSYVEPEEQTELSKTAQEIITAHLPPKEFNRTEYREILRRAWPGIEREFYQRGIPYPKKAEVETFIKEAAKSWPSAVRIARTLPRLSRGIEERLAAQAEGNALWPWPNLKAYLKKAIFGPSKEMIKVALEEAPPEERPILKEMVEKGLFSEDLEASIVWLKENGTPEDYPTIKTLEAKKGRFLAVQKEEKILEDGTVVLEDRPFVGLLKRYYEASKRAGQHQIFEPEIGMYLPRTYPAPIKKGRLQQLLDKIGLATKLYRKVKLGLGKTVVQPHLSKEIWRFITAQRYGSFSHLLRATYRRTLGRIFVALRKSRIGKAVAARLAVKWGMIKAAKKVVVQKGIKAVASKVLIWIGKKLGLAALPEPIISKALLVLSFVGDLIKLPGKAIKGIFKKIGKFFTDFLPKVKQTSQKTFDFAENAVVKTAAFIGALITGLTTFSLSAILPLLAVVAPISLVAILTWFLLQNVSSAFIISRAEGEITPYPQSEYIEVTKTAVPNSYTTEELEQIWNAGQLATVTYQIIITAKKENITVTTIEDKFSVYPAGPTIPTATTGSVDEIPAGESATYEYTAEFDSQYLDTIVRNAITVTADVEGGPSGEQAGHGASVKFGQPPISMPMGWPVSGRIVQGPFSGSTHEVYQCNCIDITDNDGWAVYATHDGIAYGYEEKDPGYPSKLINPDIYGNVVIVFSLDGSFRTTYGHLEDGSIPNSMRGGAGQEITAGTRIGNVNDTGRSSGPHLHYQLNGDPGNGTHIDNYVDPYSIGDRVESIYD